ncbi:MAG: hypothetical protein KAI72_07515 [Candidatus Pacebacteria bacterium]|nr:hypothetical protein [Candidatus Paceibacterota bacterium]
MKIIILILAVILATNSNILLAQETSSLEENKKLTFFDGPSLELSEALTLAQEYIEINKIDISKHYLDNIRLLWQSPWMKGKHWIITWRLKRPFDGGQIFIIVGMDKTIKIKKGI